MNIEKVRKAIGASVGHHVAQYVIMALLVFGSFTGLCLMNYLPTPVPNLAIGEISPRDIEAPRSLEYVDEKATDEARHQAMLSVNMVFTADPNTETQALDDVHKAFAVLREIVRHPAAKDETVRADLEARSPLKLGGAVAPLETVSSETLDQLETHLVSSLRKIMDKGVKADDLAAAHKELEAIVDKMALPADLQAAEVALAQEALRSNLSFDWAETSRQQQEKSREVPPQKASVQRGRMIVRRGDVVTPQTSEILTALGASQNHFSVPTLVGVVLFTLLSMGLLLIYMAQHAPALLSDMRLMWLSSLLLVSTAFLCHWLEQTNGYLGPVALAAMLTALLVDYRLALMGTLILSCLVGLFTGEFSYAAVSLLTGAVAVLSVAHVTRRTDLIFASLVVCLVNVLGVLALDLIKTPEWQQQLVMDAGYGALNGVIASLIAMGALPFLENLFGVTTHIKLLELANPGEPLLQKLMVEAPGTYHHSIIVANLADAAARSIGADALLARVGAYYHDIGKMKRSTFFVENQLGGDSPHERLTPSLSAMVIHSHVSEGIEMARQYRLPQPVMDFIDMHHGTRLVAYFYHQAKEKLGTDVQEESFRYHGRKPHSKETAIVMVADSIEAKARLMRQLDRESVQKMVNETLRTVMGDGQLDDSDLSLKDIKQIGDSFTTTIMSIYHNRVEYPKEVLQHLASADRSNATAAVPADTPAPEPEPPANGKPAGEEVGTTESRNA